MSVNSTLIIRLEGPMQSWGYRSRFKHRDSGLEPTKSGIIGLLCCALGRDRTESPDDLAKLKMHVRVDRQGILMTDFHTAGGGIFRGSDQYYAPTSSGNKGKNPIIMERQYLADASFTVALEGDGPLLKLLADALQDPVWPLSLGRRSCPPSAHVFVALIADEPQNAFSMVEPHKAGNLRYVWERDAPTLKTETKNDVPVSWADRLDRTYTIRHIENVSEGQA